MSKYIIDTGDYLFTTDGVLVVGFDCDNKPATFYNSLDNLEELNSDYINEHFSDLQDEAYQRGLEDAWEAARKIFGHEIDGGLDIDELKKVFGSEVYCTADIIRANTAEQAIAKLKAFDDKQKEDDSIKVGDEVIYNGTTKCLVITPETGTRYASILDCNGIHYSADHRELKKTGKHYDIQSILEAMRTHD